MTVSKDEKQAELTKYHALVVATIDYYLENHLTDIKTSDFDSDDYYAMLKIRAQDLFQKGKLSQLKQWFRDFTEMLIEEPDFNFNTYLLEKTGYEIDLFKSFYDRINKIINSGKITSHNQYYEINVMIEQLIQAQPIDTDKIKTLNNLLAAYKPTQQQKK
jgi:hypothetical protein